MTICILGRQPEIGIAELESLYGSDAVRLVGESCALITPSVDFTRLGGSTKAAQVLATLSTVNRRSIFKRLAKLVPSIVATLPKTGKIKLGLSIYGFDITPYELGGEALRLKKLLRSTDRSVRVIPNETTALSSAQTFHNSLTSDLGLELLIIRDKEQTIVARVTAVQDIDAYRTRDRERPKRDAFVGMLPPKLAQTIINLAAGQTAATTTVLDPFCGTGVVLQEALLMGYDAYGSDLSQKMVDFSTKNLDWLRSQGRWTIKKTQSVRLEQADATDHIWRQPVTTIACEGYLGQPLGGQQPTEEKMRSIIYETNLVMRGFLKNIAPQITASTRLCLAMPAWSVNDQIHHLPVIDELATLGFEQVTFSHAPNGLIYRRDDQITARELIVLKKQLK